MADLTYPTRVWTCGCSWRAGDGAPWSLCEQHATSNTRPDLTVTAPSYEAFVAASRGDADPVRRTGGEVTT